MTDYLVDIQRIEELPVNLAEDIIDTAKEIERLDGNRSKYQQSENLLTTEQYRTMQRLEDDIPDTIKNLNDMEMQDSMLKNDMGYLEGEKEDLKYARVEDTDNAYRIRSVLIVVLVLFLLISITLFDIAGGNRRNDCGDLLCRVLYPVCKYQPARTGKRRKASKGNLVTE